jgi:hypothetical protein
MTNKELIEKIKTAIATERCSDHPDSDYARFYDSIIDNAFCNECVCVDHVHVDREIAKGFDFRVEPRPWWEKYKKRDTIDHTAGIITSTGSKPYDEMWDFIVEEVIPESKREEREKIVMALEELDELTKGV